MKGGFSVHAFVRPRPLLRALGVTLAFCCHFAGGGFVRALDELESRLRTRVDAAVLWENARGGDEWISGPAPAGRPLRGGPPMSTLAPGEGICVRVPSNERLRFRIEDRGCGAGGDLMPEAAVSNGSGLLVSVRPELLRDGRTFELDPRSPDPSLVHLIHSPDADDAIEVTVFISRRFVPHDQQTYPVAVPLESTDGRVRLTAPGRRDTEAFWKVREREHALITVSGPARLQLEMRRVFPVEARSPSSSWNVLIAEREGNSRRRLANLEFLSGVDVRNPVRADGRPVNVTRLEEGFLDLPDSRDYRLEIEFSAAGFARLHRSADSAYLLPAWNAPLHGIAVGRSASSDVPASIWDWDEGAIRAALDDPFAVPVDALDSLALRLMRDNRRSDGGLLAADLLGVAGDLRPDYPALRSRAHEVRGAGTSYRSLLPAGGGVRHPREFGFFVRRLNDTGEGEGPVVVDSAFREAGLRRIPRGQFVPLPPAGRPLLYRLPTGATPTSVRVASHGSGAGPVAFRLRFDDHPASLLRHDPGAVAAPSATRPSFGEAALALSGGDPLDFRVGGAVDGFVLIETGHAELPVPSGASILRIWGETGGPDTMVAVQYRGSGDHALDEDSFRRHVERLGGTEAARQLLFGFLQTGSSEPLPARADGTATCELLNHWEPLRRYVRSHHARFIESVAEADEASIGDDWTARVDNLVAEGEFGLAEDVCRWAYLHGGRNDPAIRAAAWERLALMADQRLDSGRSIANHAAAMIVDPTVVGAAALCRLLRHDGRHDLALMLALVLPASDATLEDRLAVALQERWMGTFDSFLKASRRPSAGGIPAGIRHWLEGDPDKALKCWSSVGASGDRWARAIAASASIRTRVEAGDSGALRDWAEWELAIPGVRVWRPVPVDRVEAMRGAATIRVLESGARITWFAASPDHPLRLRFPSPTRLRIECRPLHPIGSDAPLDGWVTVTMPAAGVSRHLPVTHNFASDGLRIEGDGRQVPGMLVEDAFALTGWDEGVEIRPSGMGVFVRVLQETPEFRVGHLPALDDSSVARLFGAATRASDSAPPKSILGAALVHGGSGDWQEIPVRAPLEGPADADRDRVRAVMRELPRLAVSMDRAGQREAVSALSGLLWQRESGERDTREILAEAGALHHRHIREIPELAPIWSRMLRETEWVPLLSPIRAAGVRRIEVDRWEPENPGLRTRIALLEPPSSHEQLVADGDSLVVSLVHPEPRSVTVRVSHDSVPCVAGVPIEARIEVGRADAGEDPSPEDLFLQPGSDAVERTFLLPTGANHVRVTSVRAAPNHFLRVGVLTPDGDGDTQRRTRRDWFVATRDDPLEWRVHAPALIRLDEWQGGRVVSRIVRIGPEQPGLVLEPVEGADELLCRVHQLVPAPGKRHPVPVRSKSSITPVPPPLAASRVPHPVALEEGDGEEPDWDMESTAGATWSWGLGWERRRPLEEDEFGEASPDEFLQGDLTRRSYSEAWGAYSRTAVLARARTAGDPVAGLEQSLQLRPFDGSLTLTLSGDAHVQGSDWAAGIRATVSGKHALTRRLAHLPSMSVFLRSLSRDEYGPRPDEVDQDIFTEYKDDHRRGLSLGERLIFTPFEDSILTAGVGLTTNEDFNVFDPDSVHYRIGWEQQVGALQWEADLRGYRFFADDDRSDDSWGHRLGVEAAGEWRWGDRRRIEAGARYTRFLEEDDNAFSLFLRWHFDDGRLLRDFRPDERRFQSIRERRLRRLRRRRRGRSRNAARSLTRHEFDSLR